MSNQALRKAQTVDQDKLNNIESLILFPPHLIQQLKTKNWENENYTIFYEKLKKTKFHQFIQQYFGNCQNWDKTFYQLINNMAVEFYPQDTHIIKNAQRSTERIFFLLSGNLTKNYSKQQIQSLNKNKKQPCQKMQSLNQLVSNLEKFKIQFKEILNLESFQQFEYSIVANSDVYVVQIKQKYINYIYECHNQDFIRKSKDINEQFNIFSDTHYISNFHQFIIYIQPTNMKFGSYLTKQGQIGKYIYILIKGSIQLQYQFQENGKSYNANICTLEQSCLLGEEIMHTKNETYEYSIKVNSGDSIIYQIQKEQFSNVITCRYLNQIKQNFIQKVKLQKLKSDVRINGIQKDIICQKNNNNENQTPVCMTIQPQVILQQHYQIDDVLQGVGRSNKVKNKLNTQKQPWLQNFTVQKFENDLGVNMISNDDKKEKKYIIKKQTKNVEIDSSIILCNIVNRFNVNKLCSISNICRLSENTKSLKKQFSIKRFQDQFLDKICNTPVQRQFNENVINKISMTQKENEQNLQNYKPQSARSQIFQRTPTHRISTQTSRKFNKNN